MGAEKEFGAPDGALMELGRAGQESWWKRAPPTPLGGGHLAPLSLPTGPTVAPFPFYPPPFSVE